MAAKKEEVSKEKALEQAIGKISKEFGEGSIMKLGNNLNMEIEVITTGSINIDMALGVGGVPKGRIIEVYGAESSGKTTIALHIVAQAQKNKGVVAYIDAEHALDPEYAKALGVDVDELLISQPDYGEQALEIADLLVRSGAVDLIVVDSVAALVPKAEIDGEMSDQQMAKALRKLTGSLNKSKTTMIFINQIRDKIGGFGFGPQTTTTGGKALKFYASVRMEVKRIGSVKQGDDVIGNETTVKITKNNINNIILKKLKIALSLKSDDMLQIFKLAGLELSSSELSAVFRKEDHKNYRECGDKYIRNFLKGLTIYYRG